jgi:glycosyltransferase involved in cell wall biosynthesis
MNIVIINHYAGGQSLGMEFRPYYMAKEFSRMGHKVLIVAASYAHLRSKQPKTKGPVTSQTIDGTDYLFLRTNLYRGNGFPRIISMVIFTIRLFGLQSVLRGFKPDLFIASSTYPMDCYPVKYLSKKFRAKFCFEVHDLWPLSPIEFGGFSKWHPFIMIVQWAEDFAYKHADFVVSLLPKAKSYMVSRGLKPEKFFYIPNGIAVDEWSALQTVPDEHSTLLSTLRKQQKFIVGYAGSHGIANALDALINASPKLATDVAIVLVGNGPVKDSLVEKVKREKLENVFFLPPVSKSAIPHLLSKFDALYVAFQKQSLLRFGMSPNKMFDYMMAEKPIIQAIEAGNNMVVDYSCGIDVEPENPTAIAEGIKRLKNMSLDSRIELGKNGKTAVLKFHDYKILCEQFVNAYKVSSEV